ncbi:choice-of-anchor J domain-containing protein, partial [Vicingaceae bacterium]|nr:choice-of-anchor J domain-containing protein [Vicingaceae bacterium]
GGLAQDWLVTPQFIPTSTTNLLTFMQRQSYTTNYGSVYKVFISTGSQTTHADFTLVDTQVETDFTYYYTIKEIDLTAYQGVPIYVAFVLEQDDGDNWLIDDVALTASASCLAPDNLSASNFGLNFATVLWSETGSAINWRIEYGASGFTPGTGINLLALDTSFNLTGLNPSSTYEFYVASVCAPGDTSTWTGPFSFSTLTAPIVPDYLNDFANFPGLNWSEASGPLLAGPTGTLSDWESDFYLNTAGDTSAKVNLYFFNSNHWLISPDFDLSGGSYELNLDAGVTGWNVTTASNMGSDDQVDLLISIDYGANWSSLYQWNASNTPSNTGTPIPTVNLTPYIGTVRFALLASDGASNDPEDYDFYIDNFSITAIVGPCENSDTDVVVTCDSLTWIDGVTYTVSNNSATHVLTNAAGCDSTVTLDLTINNSNTGEDVITACDSYTWIDGVTYTVSNNSATHVLTNAAGCDSTVTLDLTINNSNTGVDVITACDSYTWIDGVTYTVSNNSATHVLTNAAGCDSTVTLDLTINNSNTGVDVITAVNVYTWIDGVTYTASNNSATHVLTNATGCDSTVTLGLTVIIINVSVTQSGTLLTAVESGATYQWLNCTTMTAIPGATNQSFTVTTNGDYAVEITKNGYSATSICYTVIGVGVIEKSFNNEILLYPNPTNGNFSIDIGETFNTVKITITDMSGKLIQSKNYNENQLINLELEFPAGVYLLIIESGDKNDVIRLVKE